VSAVVERLAQCSVLGVLTVLCCPTFVWMDVCGVRHGTTGELIGVVAADIRLAYLQQDIVELTAAAKLATEAGTLNSFLVVDQDQTLLGSSESQDAATLAAQSSSVNPPASGKLLAMNSPGSLVCILCFVFCVCFVCLWCGECLLCGRAIVSCSFMSVHGVWCQQTSVRRHVLRTTCYTSNARTTCTTVATTLVPPALGCTCQRRLCHPLPS